MSKVECHLNWMNEVFLNICGAFVGVIMSPPLLQEVWINQVEDS